MTTLLRAFFGTIAVICLLAAIAVLFFAPFEELASGRGVRSRSTGDMFVGLAALLGEPTARILVSASFLGFAWLLWPSRRRRERGPTAKLRKRREQAK